MPGKDITATGSFTPVVTSYTVNYYEKNLTGDEYTLAESETKQANHNEQIAVNIADAKAIEGFTAAGATVSSGAAGGSAPGTLSSTLTGTASAVSGKTLNVNYYYTRNSYTLTLKVWKGDRADNKMIYSKNWTLPYGSVINAADYSEADKTNWGNNDDLSQYTLADYADWSTGDAPATMPAGDISVSRDYVSNVLGSYQVEVYFEGATAGTFTKKASLTYYANVGTSVSIGSEATDTVKFTDLEKIISDYKYYDYDSANAQNVTSGKVAADSTTTLKVYYTKKVSDVKISYYYRDGTDNKLIGTVSKSVRWGDSYTFDPAAVYYGTGSPSENYTSGGLGKETYNFKDNNYSIYYVGYYWDDGNHWPNKYITKGSELTTYTVPYGNGSTGYMNVYYTKIDPEQQTYVDIVHNPMNLTAAGDKTDHPITYTYGGKEYKVRITNYTNIYESTFSNGTTDAAYPVAALLNGTWTVTDTLKAGYTQVNIGSGTYYINGDYLYIADTKNSFYYGHYGSFKYTDTMPGYSQITDYLAGYKTAHAADDPKAEGAYIYNDGIGYLVNGNATYRITYRYANYYQLAYCLGSQYSNQEFMEGKSVTPSTPAGVFDSKAGYHLAWFTDYALTKPATTFTINNDTVLYGKYVKDTLKYHEYVYYQLADDIDIGGTSTSYITSDNMDKVTLTSDSSTSTVSFTDGEGNVSQKEVTTTRYYYNGTLVMIDKVSPVLSYTEITMVSSNYGRSGYEYDETRTENALKKTIEGADTSLAAYFARNEHTLLKTTNETKGSNSVTDKYRYGQSVSVSAPSKNGYTFGGWKWEKYDKASDSWSTWTDAPSLKSDNSVSFTMPDADLRITAIWEPAAFDSTVTHYFQNASQTYDKNTLTQIKASGFSQTQSVSVNGTATSATVYYTDSGYTTILGVSVTSDRRVTYYKDVTNNGGALSVTSAGLFAVEQTVNDKSDAVIGADAYKLNEYDMFSYSFTVYRDDDGVSTLRSGSTFKYTYGMDVSYYYTRNTYAVNAVSKASDGGVTDTIVSGMNDSCYYGTTATLKASVGAGYTFRGWYKAADVLKNYDASGTTALGDYSLKDDISSAAAVSTATTYSFTVLGNTDYVAISTPDEPSIKSITISGKNSYSYGYTSDDIEQLKADVTVGGADDYVSGYQWYAGDTKLEGETTSSYSIPEGKASGSYQYKCVATVTNKNNGRTRTAASELYTINVGAVAMDLEAESFNGTYDGNPHGIMVTVNKPTIGNYVIYYSTDTALNKDNYATSGTTEKPVFTDVKMTDGAVGSYTVYYYVHSTDNNYNDASGQGTVTISPKLLTLKSADVFSKTYDGTAQITGTDLTRLLSGNYYSFQGMTTDDQKSGYRISGTAAFNSKNVSDAGTVTLSDIKVTDAAGNINGNYAFANGYSMVIPGFINQRELGVTWGTTTSFIYDGNSHIPEVSLAGTPVSGENVEVTANTAQTNVGVYTAYAEFTGNDTYDTKNYQMTGSVSCPFTITARELTVAPNTESVIYDGKEHALTTFTTTGLVEGQKLTAGTDNVSSKAAGTYSIKAQGARILSGTRDVTENYTITYGSADLKITPKTVTFSGIKASDKVYDGNTDAVLNSDALAFNGIVEGDELSLTGLTGTFDGAGVGTDKSVALSGAVLSGTSASNYTLDTDNSQKTAKASITGKELTVTAADKTVTYGDSVNFTSAITGFVTGESDSLVTGTAVYKIRDSKGNISDYTTKTPAGTYDIIVDTSGLSSADYTFTAGTPARLTVNKKDITVAAAANKTITKVYDGTTAATVAAADFSFDGIINGDAVKLTYTAAYNSADAASADKVNMKGLGIDNANYRLTTSDFSIPATITRAPLTITAENKTTTYGKAAPAFSVTYSGFKNKETNAALSGSLTYACTYDTGTAADRNSGNYDITPSGYTSTNYEISYVKGTLTINKAVITVTADSFSDYTYGAALPTYTGKYSGFQYTDGESVITDGAPEYSCKATTSSPADKYTINVDVSSLKAANYSFKAAAGTLTVNRRTLTISGITVADKVYDGTTAVDAKQINTGNVTYTGIEEGDKSGAGITVSNAVYDNKNVGTRTVSLTYTLNSSLSSRYVLDNASSQKTADSSITKKDLTIKANDKTVNYGATDPIYEATYSGFVSGEGTADLTGSLQYGEDYDQNDPAGSYTITPSGYSSDNYNIIYNTGTLTVSKAALATPKPVWSSTEPGTVSWDAVSGIGLVTVSRYSLTLYKDGTSVYTTTTTAASADLLSEIKNAGAGKYYVTVTAVADTANNDGKANVADSAAGTSGYKYAAMVNVKYAADAATTNGGDTVTIEGGSSLLMVAGEENKALAAAMKNETGYTVKSWTSSSTALSIGNQSQNGKAATAAASMSYGLAGSDAITITLTLAARPATITASASVSPTSVDYGYTVSPIFTATAGVGTGDNIASDGYTYSYQWRLKMGAGGAITDVSGATNATYTMPEGYKASTSTYRYCCDVTATRKDNGESITKETPLIFMVINRIGFSAASVTMGDWTYGQARTAPVTAAHPDKVVPTISYSSDGGQTYSSDIPKNAGSYTVKALYPQSENYNAIAVTDSFVIKEAKLATPGNLQTVASPTAPYGKVTWDAVAGPAENNGTNSDSHINVSYKVTLYRDGTQVGDSVTTDETYYDFTSEFNAKGTYTFTVQALATCTNGNTGNCADSDVSEAGGSFDIEKTMDSQSYKKVYDGKAITLNAEAVTGATYQWLRDNEAVTAEGDSSTYDVTYVEQSGTYTCEITLNGHTYYSPNHVVTITPKDVTITANTASRDYNGSPLTDSGFTAVTLADGDTATCVQAATITNVGSVTNTAGAVVIKDKTGTEVYTDDGTANNYTVTKVPGTLTVSRRSIGTSGGYASDIKVADIPSVVYDSTAHTPLPVVTCTGLTAGSQTLVKDKDYTLSYSNNTNAGTATVTITGKGNFSGEITKTFEITKRAITVTSASPSKTYDGSPLTSSGTGDLTVSGAGLGTNDSLGSVNFTGSQTAYGTSFNTFDSLTIVRGGSTVNDNYTITPAYGTLTVNQKDLGTAGITVADIAAVGYNSTARTPLPTVTYSEFALTNKTLTAGTDYTLAYSNNINAGTATVTITGTGNYSGTISKNFTINKEKITLMANAKTGVYLEPLKTLDYAKTGTVYAGDDLKIGITTTATATSDVGKYPITISCTAGSNYDVTVTTAEYEITSGTIGVTASGYTGIYDGASHSISVTATAPSSTATVYYGTEPLTSTNYSTSGSTANPSYTAQGTYTVYYYVVAKNYADASGSKTVQIDRKALSGNDIRVDSISSVGYDSKAHTPLPVVKDGSKTLVKNTDYTLSYSDNTNAGTAKVTITGIGNYSGTISKNFTINKEKITLTANAKSGVYLDPLKTLDYVQTGNIYAGDDLGIVISTTATANSGAGTYPITITYTENSNYDVMVTNASYVIARGRMEYSHSDYSGTYDGKAHSIDLNVTTPSGAVVYYSTEELTAENYTKAGSTTMPTFTASGTHMVYYFIRSNDYADVSGSNTVTISKKELGSGAAYGTGITVGNIPEVTYSASAYTPVPDVSYSGLFGANKGLTAGQDYTVVYSGNKNAGTATITITGIGNYSGTISKTFVINKAKLTIAAKDAGTAYGETPTKLEAEFADGTAPQGSDDLGIGASSVVTSTTPVGTYEITPTYKETGNYDVTVRKATYTVKAAEPNYDTTGYDGTYDGDEHTGEIQKPSADTRIYYSTVPLDAGNYESAGSAVIPKFENAGKYKIYYYIVRDNYKDTSGVLNVEIERLHPEITAEAKDFVYDGKSHSITGKTNSDGQLTYSDNNAQIKAGIYDVSLSTAETQNCYAANATIRLTIHKRSLTLTADSAKKTYDGSALTAKGYSVTAGTLADGDRIASIKYTGVQTKAGTGSNKISSVVIRNSSGEDVTDCYSLKSISGELKVAAATAVKKTSSSSSDSTGISDLKTGDSSKASGDTTKKNTTENNNDKKNTVKQKAGSTAEKQYMSLFNILALILLIGGALYSALSSRRTRRSKLTTVILAAAGILTAILTFHAGTMILFNKYSIIFGALLIVTIGAFFMDRQNKDAGNEN